MLNPSTAEKRERTHGERRQNKSKHLGFYSDRAGEDYTWSYSVWNPLPVPARHRGTDPALAVNEPPVCPGRGRTQIRPFKKKDFIEEFNGRNFAFRDTKGSSSSKRPSVVSWRQRSDYGNRRNKHGQACAVCEKILKVISCKTLLEGIAFSFRKWYNRCIALLHITARNFWQYWKQQTRQRTPWLLVES